MIRLVFTKIKLVSIRLSVNDSSMNQDKDFKSRSKKRKREEGKSPF